jgi:hypothetical protein
VRRGGLAGALTAVPLGFNTLLCGAGVRPSDVRLLRHQDTRAARGRSVYGLWRDDRAGFEAYQRWQRADHAARFASPYWASFVAAPDAATLFVGLYRVLGHAPAPAPQANPLSGEISYDAGEIYTLELAPALSDFIGLLAVEWGEGARSWVQRADRQDKRVVELRRELKDPDFPGAVGFVSQLSDIEDLPSSWVAALAAARGVYLLTCPQTHEQYVGSATGADGFFGRWLEYARSGHGGNVALKSRDPSDYRVSILETAGSAASVEDILAREARWKAKLQSREMGLNRN